MRMTAELEAQMYVVRLGISGLSYEDVENIAMLCLTAKAVGGNFSVWHNAAAYFQRPCNCHECNPNRTVHHVWGRKNN